jgi:serine/threonine protein phosphatase PrpC
MGTTLVVALVASGEAFVANIGDSRCYHLSGQELKQITTDHSLVERLVAAKQITREEARVHPQRNYIYRTVGDKPQVEADLFKVNLRPGDALVLCSDGLHGMVEDPVIQETLLHSPHPQAACEELIRLANVAGGDDNVTVIVVQMLEVKGNR